MNITTLKNYDLEYQPTRLEESPQINVKKKLKDILVQKSRFKEWIIKVAED